MRKGFITKILLIVLVSGQQSVLAQENNLPSNPRDFTGVWMNDNTLDETLKRLGKKRLAPGETLDNLSAARLGPEILTPDYQTVFAQQQQAANQLSEGAQNCAWPGMPIIMTYPYPFEMLQSADRITMIFEVDSQVRRIFLDRSEHLPFDELDPTYNGDSIGHWEGNTLVIDTVGFHSHTLLWGGLPHSDQLHIVERIAYVNADTIHNEIVINDAKALTKPIERTVVYSKRPSWRIREYSCLENNRDRPNAEGNRADAVVNQ